VKVIEIRLTDEQYQRFHAEVGEIVSLAAYMEVGVRIYDAPKYASGGYVPGSSYGMSTRLTET